MFTVVVRIPGSVKLGAVAALLASTTLACGSGQPPAAPAGTTTATRSTGTDAGAIHTEALDSIAVMGHRYAIGAGSDPTNAFSPAPENVWATGENPKVQSVYQRLLATHPVLKGHNFNVAQDFASVAELEHQLDRLLGEARPLPDVVIIHTVAFDSKCDGTDPDNYEPYAAALDRLLQRIHSEIGGVQVFVAGDVGTAASFAPLIPGQKEIHGGGPCALWDASGKVSPAGVRSMQAIMDGYWTRAKQVCGRYPWCFADDRAFRGVRLELADLTGDYRNLTIAGHAKLAAAAWRALPDEIKARP